jgi:hypothetical protein
MSGGKISRDYIAVYIGEKRNTDEFPVVFLDHDGYGSRQLAASFDEFLVAWEELRYLHGFFLCQYFMDAHGATLDTASPRKAALDELFRLGRAG